MAAMVRNAGLLLSSMAEPAPANNTVSDPVEIAGRGVPSVSSCVAVGVIAASSGLSRSSDIGFSSFGGGGVGGSLFLILADAGLDAP